MAHITDTGQISQPEFYWCPGDEQKQQEYDAVEGSHARQRIAKKT